MVGSATVQGQLWGTAPHDWVQIIEPLMIPIHSVTLAALAPLTGLSLLDAGCGCGLALRLAADQGARVSGLDASSALLDVTRGRLPDADLRVGDIEELPYDDATFDVVTAFNSIQYAFDPKTAVAELARVARPGGRIAIEVWGEPALCETEVFFARLRELAAPPPGTAAPLAVSEPGVVEGLLTAAGLEPYATGTASCPFSYPDLDTGWRGQSAAGPLQRVIQLVGEQPVREAFDQVHARNRQPDGSYRQQNVFRYVLARKPG
jgi:SAM-dependent methyltransferase